MRSIDGHFSVVNEPGKAVKIASELLTMFESLRTPEHIIITQETIQKASFNASKLMLEMLDTYIAIVDEKFEKLGEEEVGQAYPKIEKAQELVVSATRLAERNSTKRNWNKLDTAQKRLAKELDRAGFNNFANYADSINVQSSVAIQRKELTLQKANYIAQKQESMNRRGNIRDLTPSQIITVIAEVVSHRPKTNIGTLPIVFDDAFRDLNADTKLRALELLKSYSNEYATWYITDDPLVLGWSGFNETEYLQAAIRTHKIYDFELDVA